MKAGFGYVPVISLNFSGLNDNPGLKLTVPMVMQLVQAVMYGDLLLMLKNQCRPYEIEAGQSEALADAWTARLAEQMYDDASVYNYYRQAVAIRQAIPAISHGRTTAEASLNQNCISAFRKTWNEEECLVLMNVNMEAAEVDLSAYTDWTLCAKLSADGGEIAMNGTTLTLPPYGTAVLQPNA